MFLHRVMKPKTEVVRAERIGDIEVGPVAGTDDETADDVRMGDAAEALVEVAVMKTERMG